MCLVGCMQGWRTCCCQVEVTTDSLELLNTQTGRVADEDLEVRQQAACQSSYRWRGWQSAKQLAQLGPAPLLDSEVEVLAGLADVAEALHCCLQVPQGVLCQYLLQHQGPQLYWQG